MRQDFLSNFHDSSWPALITTDNTLMYSCDKRMHNDKITEQGGSTTQKNVGTVQRAFFQKVFKICFILPYTLIPIRISSKYFMAILLQASWLKSVTELEISLHTLPFPNPSLWGDLRIPFAHKPFFLMYGLKIIIIMYDIMYVQELLKSYSRIKYFISYLVNHSFQHQKHCVAF